MQENNQGDIRNAIEAGKLLATKPFDVAGTPMIIIPDDHSLKSMPELRVNPDRIKQKTSHTTADSFINYYNEFATDDSVIFINQDGPSFNAVIDYHGNEPGWNEHHASFILEPTKEFDNWKDHDKQWMNQVDFGLFIEENLEEITHPSGAEMLEIALSIQATTKTKFSSAQRLDNGQTQLTFAEEINGTAGAKGELKIPQTFKIGLRLYEGGEAYEIEVRLRYRISQGQLTLCYELIRSHKTIEANVKDTENLINEKIKVGKIYHGKFYL